MLLAVGVILVLVAVDRWRWYWHCRLRVAPVVGSVVVVALVDVELDDVAVTGPGGLLERLGALTDPRARRGKRHQLAGLLAIAAAAVLGGARSYAEVAEFARELPAVTLARLGVWRRPWSTCYVAPSEATLRRTLQQVDADALDRVVGGWLAAQQEPASATGERGAVAVDGTTLRGAVGDDGRQVHLLAVLAHGSGTGACPAAGGRQNQ